MKRATVGRLAAECLVIVIGVLVALAVDQWRTEVEEDRQLVSYLAGLEADLVADSASLAGDAIRAEQVAIGLEVLLAVVEDPGVEYDEARIARALLELQWIVDPPIRSGTWTDLVSSGNLRLLDDSALRQTLSAYYTYMARARNWGRMVTVDYDEWPAGVTVGFLSQVTTRVTADVWADVTTVLGSIDVDRAISAIRADTRSVQWLIQRRTMASDMSHGLLDLLGRRTLPALQQVRQSVSD